MEPQTEPTEVANEIKQALRNAQIGVARIAVEVRGTEITLEGCVRSEIERQEAELTAQRVSGVSRVENRITIERSTGEDAGGDPVYEASLESFPASDPPAWTVGTAHIEGPEESPEPTNTASSLTPSRQRRA